MANILVIEDDPSVLLLLTYTLAAEGHDVEAIDSGSEALARLDGPPPDAVLSDVMLPGGSSGIDVLRAMRQRPDWAEVPVIILSALSTDDDVWNGWAAGATSYVTKPYDADDLISLLHEQLAAAPPPDGGGGDAVPSDDWGVTEVSIPDPTSTS